MKTSQHHPSRSFLRTVEKLRVLGYEVEQIGLRHIVSRSIAGGYRLTSRLLADGWHVYGF